MFQSAKQKRLSHIVFWIYCILLAWLVLFKFAVSLSQIPHIRGINLIPFYYTRETSVHGKEVLYNILVFIPFGVYVQIFREAWKPAAKCMAAALTSFVFETVQFIFAIGASDLTDLIANTFGAAVGMLFCIVMKRTAPGKYISMINVMGILIELAAVGLLVVLLAANS